VLFCVCRDPAAVGSLFKSHRLPYWLSEVEVCTVLIKNIVEETLQRKLKEMRRRSKRRISMRRKI
jgi:hypothetical protein